MSTKRNIFPYNPDFMILARELRKNMTLSEVLLWNELKQKNMLGYDFDRQHPVQNYIVDFIFKEFLLAIEINGNTHYYRDEEDEKRQEFMEKLGIQFLRFEDIEVKKNILNVLWVIEDWIKKNEKPTPSPSKEGSLLNEYHVKSKLTPGPSKERSLNLTPLNT
jgi:very-short-patch-repair endonuclease